MQLASQLWPFNASLPVTVDHIVVQQLCAPFAVAVGLHMIRVDTHELL